MLTCLWESSHPKGGKTMPLVALPAHYDGKQICLDEEYPLAPDMKLIVTVLPQNNAGDQGERDSWLRLSNQNLERAYGDDEPEYSSDLIKEVKPSHEAR